MSFKKLFTDEKGQSAVIAGVAIFMVIAVSALALDIGLVHIQSSREQTAADAAALAGGTLLPAQAGDIGAEANVKNRAAEYAVKNGIPAEDVLPEKIILGDIKNGMYTSVRVELKSEVGFGFAKVLGFEKADVTKAAKAQLKPVSAMNDLVPLGVTEDAMQTMYIGKTLTVKKGGGDGVNGFFGAIDLDGTQGGGAKDYTGWLSSGYDVLVEQGDILPVENGVMSGPSWDGFCARVCKHTPKCTASSYDPQCSSIVTLIVYKVHETQGNDNNIKSIEVMGFVPFILHEGTKQGEITAICIQTVIQDGLALPGANDFGVYKITLVE
ncbi:MAG: hypothetical protein BWY11_00320 [Firmicutes bacterium ADurb.Bin182]|nr:MAG: hypothetical protein BWY11_00320 [Firmicutes bacterium ADurb.Bin182]